MKMTKLIGTLALGVGMLILLAPSANAVCSPAKLFTTWDFTDGIYYYVYFGAGSNESTDFTIGAYWEPGNRGLANEGTCDDSAWLKNYYGSWYISGSWGDACTVGCAGGGLIVSLVDDKGTDADFAVGSADETPAKAAHYNLGAYNFTPLPRPKVMGGSAGIVDLQFDDPAPGFSSRFGAAATSVITGINLYTFVGDDPGRGVGSWTLNQTVPYAGGATSLAGFDVGCAGTRTQLAAGLQFDGGAYDTPLVSAPTTISCGDPTIADPDDKFDIIKTKGKGLKRGKPFRD